MWLYGCTHTCIRLHPCMQGHKLLQSLCNRAIMSILAVSGVAQACTAQSWWIRLEAACCIQMIHAGQARDSISIFVVQIRLQQLSWTRRCYFAAHLCMFHSEWPYAHRMYPNQLHTTCYVHAQARTAWPMCSCPWPTTTSTHAVLL